MSDQNYVLVALLPENNIDAYWIGPWVGPWAGRNILETRKILTSAGIRTPVSCTRSLGAIPTTEVWYIIVGIQDIYDRQAM
jgi:hypothetical protein